MNDDLEKILNKLDQIYWVLMSIFLVVLIKGCH